MYPPFDPALVQARVEEARRRAAQRRLVRQARGDPAPITHRSVLRALARRWVAGFRCDAERCTTSGQPLTAPAISPRTKKRPSRT